MNSQIQEKNQNYSEHSEHTKKSSKSYYNRKSVPIGQEYGGELTFESLVRLVHCHQAEEHRCSEESVRNVLKTLILVVNEALRQNVTVRLPKLGEFFNRLYQPRKVRSPITGEIKTVEGRLVPAFRFFSSVKERLCEEIADNRKK